MALSTYHQRRITHLYGYLQELHTQALAFTRYGPDFYHDAAPAGFQYYRTTPSLREVKPVAIEGIVDHQTFNTIVFGTVGTSEPQLRDFRHQRALTIINDQRLPQAVQQLFRQQVQAIHACSQTERAIYESEDPALWQECYRPQPPEIYISVPAECRIHEDDFDLDPTEADRLLEIPTSVIVACVTLDVDIYTMHRRWIAKWLEVWSHDEAVNNDECKG